MPDVDLPSAETEGEPDPVYLPPGECIQNPIPHLYGYSHQCEGTITVSYDAQSGTYQGEDSFSFGPGKSNPSYWTDEDSYDNPLVAACCGPFDYENPTTEQKIPYINNCLLDAAQQICHGLPYFLRKQAEEADTLAKKWALNGLADDVEDMAGSCLIDLWSGGPPGPDGFNINQLNGTTWSPNNNVTFKIVETEVTDWTVDGEVTWNTCGGIQDNDGAVVPTAPFTVPGTVGTVTAALVPGTTMTGSGPGSSSGMISPVATNSSLTLVYLSGGPLQVSGLQLNANSSMVTAYGETITLERSSVILRNVMEPSFAGGEYTVPTGAAHFTVTTAFDGDSRIVDMTNDGPVVFRETLAGEWEFDPFDLTYVESGVGTWTLSFDGLTFAPPS